MKNNELPADPGQKLTAKHGPSDFFFLQRSVAGSEPSLKALTAGLEDARNRYLAKSQPPGFNAPWSFCGPGNLGGRVNTLAIHPLDDNIFYAGFSSGGLFKTTDGGDTWTSLFDQQLFLAIGAIAIDPLHPETVYVGTGDPNISGYPFIGDGVYKSTDGGQTWQHLGLTDQRIVAALRIDPVNPQVIYAACMGLPFERNTERGLYRSTNGGQTWEQVLFISEQAGVIDLVMDPQDPQVLYAASWDRIRNNSESIVSGPHARIYKSTDGGDQWTQLTNGLPAGAQGRIGLAISRQNPQKVYALYVGTNQEVQGLYQTLDGGQTWSARITAAALGGLSAGALGGFGWYFGKVVADPLDDDHVFILGVDLWESFNGGQLWDNLGPPWWTYDLHADKHALVFTTGGEMLAGTDGGIFRSADGGQEWTKLGNLPVTQFYRVAFNPHLPDNYYGGAQDNGTTGGQTLAEEWARIFGSDGFQPAFHPELPEVFYVETQFGGISYTDSGGDFFAPASNGINFSDRRNFDMPYQLSTHDPNILYTGTYRVYRSQSGIVPSWEPISEDLTDGLILNPNFHTISTLHECPLQPGLLYVGTTDANVWRTDNGGENWINLTDGLPERYVTDIKASPDRPDYVYVAHSGYKDNDFTPRLHRSSDRGQSWEPIAGDLPDLAINDIFILPEHQDSILFVGTDGGVYASLNRGVSWRRLGNNLPFVAVYDLEWNPVRREIFAGTYGRSIVSYPVDTLLSPPAWPPDTVSNQADPLLREAKLHFFPNPTQGQLVLEMQNGLLKGVVRIFNMEGKLLLTRATRSEQRLELDLQALPPGVYFLQLAREGRRPLSGSFVLR